MSIRTIPGEPWTDPGAVLTYDRLDRNSLPTALIEPKTIGAREWVDADITAIAATAPIGTFGTLTVSGGDVTVPAQTLVELTSTATVADGLDLAALVLPDQRHPKCIYIGYLALVDTGGGVMKTKVKLLVYNLATTSATVADAATINFAIVRNGLSPQPTSPNATLDVRQAKHWNTPNEPLTPDNLNLMAAPTARVRPNSIGVTELNPTALDGLAALKAGRRAAYTLGSPLTVSTRDAANVTTSLAMPGALVAGSVVRVSAVPPAPSPLFTGFVSAANTVTLQARLNDFGSRIVASGTVLRVAVFQP